MVIRNTPLKQRGSAIVLALGITALVVVLSVAMLTALSSDMKRTQKIISLDMQHSLLYAAESRAITLLSRHDSDHDATSLDQLWGVPWTYEQEGLRMQAQIFDEQSRFNINSLKRKEAPKDDFSPKAVFERLAAAVYLNDPDAVLQAAQNSWQPWVGITQLKPILGDEFLKLMPYISAQESRVISINVNTASAMVLSAVLGISLKNADMLVAAAPYSNIESFDAELGRMDLSVNGEVTDWLTTESRHFILRTQIKGKRTFEFYSVIAFKDQNWTVIQRSQGGLS